MVGYKIRERMIRMIQSMSAAHAKSYYTEALTKADYYIDGQELNGTFNGRLSNRLGITGPVTRDAFFALCENRHPFTGTPLTPRTKQERKIGYDINFHVPKSVSILHALANDNHILDAFRECVLATMQDMEALVRVRVRRGGVYEDRVSSEALWADFIHQTARPVEGFAPDPHLHAHCFIFNMAWDDVEGRVKASKLREINKEVPFFQAMFHKRLADTLINLGYQIRPTEKSFEVIGIPQEVISLFSKRTDEIGRVAKEKGITDARELSELGARTRAKKDRGLSMDDLKREWKNQIIQLEKGKEAIEDGTVRFSPEKAKQMADKGLTWENCVDYSLLHNFERFSVVPKGKLIATAIHHSIGSLVNKDDIIKGLDNDARIIRVEVGSDIHCTTKEVLQEEQRMVSLASAGRNRFTPLYFELPEIKADGQQGLAISHILSTTDMVSIVRGAAGAGKTTIATEARKHIRNAGKDVFFVAPTSRASRGVLRDEGFKNAQTVAALLENGALQNQLKDQVLWVDEAGMLGTKDMAALLEITTRQNARLILGGDTRQHASVVRGDALRILNTVGGIQTAEVDKIYRQRDEIYRSAVADLSKGNIRDGFDKLDSLGAIKQAGRSSPYGTLIKDYMTSLKEGKHILTISPTHAVGDIVNESIRKALRDAGALGKREISADKYKSLGWTAAQKTDWRNLQKGMVVQFNQNQKGIKRGSCWTIETSKEESIDLINRIGEKAQLDISKPDHFDVYKHSKIPVAKGDKIMVTRNGFDKAKKRLDSGLIFEVASVTRKSGIILRNPKGTAEHSIDADFGNITHAYCVTSHKSQGQTVDNIFVVQPKTTFLATNAKQFYVSVSRAREKVVIYTDDKQELLDYASQKGDRTGAMELLKGNVDYPDHVLMLQRDPDMHITQEGPREPEISSNSDFIIEPTENLENYEPGL